ncbi:MAG TPA: SpoIID/LytB domain-containing protein [Jatrophihabitantaceae bacterium]
MWFGVVLLAVGIASAGLPAAADTTSSGSTPAVGGLLPAQSADVGDCAMSGVTCKPPLSGSCTEHPSQSAPPSTIKVFLGADRKLVTVPFESYVENVLPNEWIASWDGDALKAGAVAVKSYAWYWVTHFGGYLDGDQSNCFDVTDDQAFQVYKAGTATDRTNAVVQETWPVAARVNGQILETSYRAFLHAKTESCGAYADGTTMSQYGTQACNEASTGNKYNVILGIYYAGVQLATARQVRTPHDFQFLQSSTRVTFHAGTWTLADGYATTFRYGTTGDVPVVTNNGDGFAHVGVFRPSSGTWYLASPTGHTASTVAYGTKGDVPVQAHYSGVDRPTVLGVFRPSTGTWYLRGHSAMRYGTRGDVPVPGHYFGTPANHYADGIAVYRPSTGMWYLAGHSSVHWGAKGDIPMPADYDGNGTTDIAVYRPSTHTFYLRGHAGVRYGTSGDIPVTGDFTGDGKADLALYRPSNHAWYVHGSASVIFGAAGVTPIGAAPYHD